MTLSASVAVYEPSEEHGNLFVGYRPRECGEHRTVGGHRAWCFDCAEWCYSSGIEMGCRGCQASNRHELLTAVRGVQAVHRGAEGMHSVSQRGAEGTPFGTLLDTAADRIDRVALLDPQVGEHLAALLRSLADYWREPPVPGWVLPADALLLAATILGGET